MKTITLQTRSTTYQIGVSETGFLLHLYYGPRVDGDMSNLLTYGFRGDNGIPYEYKENPTFSCDWLPQEYSCCGSGDYRNHAFRSHAENGACGADLRYQSHRFTDGKYSIPGLPASYGSAGVQTCEIVLADANAGVEVVLKYGVFFDDDVITRCAEVRNTGAGRLYLNKVMSASFDFLTGEYDLIHFSGRHFNEMHPERTRVGCELISIGSRRGVSSHQHNPFAILASRSACEDSGSCYGMALVYSGNFVLQAEQDQYARTRLQMGLSDELFDYRLESGDAFYAPEVLLAYSEHGFGGLSRLYHPFLRQHVCRGKYKNLRRPVLINNWEATYFGFTGKKLVALAREAAQLGIEMFVLDDGWFGRRDLDDKALGDWTVNEEKMGGPLREVVRQINALGLKFGLWIEPEMVNENSELYRAHPDWALQIPGKRPVLGRTQLPLDFTRPEVREGVLAQIAAVIDSANIEYIKMDMNRSLCDLYSAAAEYQNFGELAHRYMLGVYDFLEQLETRYPELLVEGCSSGGARFDAGMMYYTPQIWASDNTDAIERLGIQYGASFGYPVSVVGSHVSAVPNHQNGRVTPLHTRSVVAMSGNFGYELDLTKLSAEEKEEIRGQILAFQRDWELIHNGAYYRVSDAAELCLYAAWNMVSPDRRKALLNAVTTNTHANSQILYVRCKGLEDSLLYTCAETKERYPGAVLRTIGLPLPPLTGEYHAWQYHLTAE